MDGLTILVAKIADVFRRRRCGGVIPFPRDYVLQERVDEVDVGLALGGDNRSVNIVIGVKNGHDVIIKGCFSLCVRGRKKRG